MSSCRDGQAILPAWAFAISKRRTERALLPSHMEPICTTVPDEFHRIDFLGGILSSWTAAMPQIVHRRGVRFHPAGI
jgi:hypothetical protein